MVDYLIGGIFFLLFIALIYYFGKAISKDTSKSMDFLIGYIVYSFFVAIGGILAQIIKFPWKYFMIYIVLILLGMLITTICCFYKKKIKILLLKDIGDFIKENWFVFFVIGVLIITLCFNLTSLWFGNHLDDGFYVTKIASYGHMPNPYSTNFSTGLTTSGSFGSYTLNTFEIEASVFVYLLRIDPMVYIRFVLTAIHLFILCMCIVEFTRQIFEALDIRCSTKSLQYSTVIIILFAVNEAFMRNTSMIFLQDGNQFTTAMYYGSVLVKTISIMLLVLPFLKERKLNWKIVLFVMMTSVVLISKSTIALPIIVMTCLSYLIATYWKQHPKIVIAGIVLLFVCGIFLNKIESVAEISAYGAEQIPMNATSIVLILASIIFLLSFLFKNEFVNKVNKLIISLVCMTCLPFMNHITALFSIFCFVMGRAFSCVAYSLIILAFIYLYAFVFKYAKRKVMVVSFVLVSTMLVGVIDVVSIKKAGGTLFFEEEIAPASLRETFSVFKTNMNLFPRSTKELGQKLQALHETTNTETNVVVRELNLVNGRAHSLATQVRTYAPNIHCISAIYRYDSTNDERFKTYSDKDQMKYEEFMTNPCQTTYQKFKKVLKKYPINTIVVNQKNSYMKKLNYKLYDEVIDEQAGVHYYIYAQNQ